jgi:hypothetical protein
MENKSDRYEDRGNFFPDINAINKISEKITKSSYSNKNIKEEQKIKHERKH